MFFFLSSLSSVLKYNFAFAVFEEMKFSFLRIYPKMLSKYFHLEKLAAITYKFSKLAKALEGMMKITIARPSGFLCFIKG